MFWYILHRQFLPTNLSNTLSHKIKFSDLYKNSLIWKVLSKVSSNNSYQTDYYFSLENRHFHKKCIKNFTQCKRHHIKLYGKTNFTSELIQKKCRSANCTRRTTGRWFWFIYPSGHTTYIEGKYHVYMTT